MSLRPRTSPTSADALFNNLDYAGQHSKTRIYGRVRSAHLEERQQRWLLATAAVALIVGFITSPVIARALPFGLDGQVAAFILETDRWNAGVALMQAQSPHAWRVLMD